MRILLADYLDNARELLLPEGFNVHVTTPDDEAISLGKMYEFDAIVLRDASGVLKSLRAAKVKTPIVVVSELDDVGEAVRALGLGADDYVTRDGELIARIHAVVRRCRGHAVSKIDAGPLTLNLDTREANVHGAPLRLTGKEYHILECLMLRKGHVQTKEQLLNALYGGRDEPELKIIDVFICKLRRKITATGAADPIETIWGRGYLIRDEVKEPDLGEVAGIRGAFGGRIDVGDMIETRDAMRSPPLAPAD